MTQIQLTKGHIALIDDADLALVSQWAWRSWGSHKGRGNYAYRRPKENGKRRDIFLHRFLMGLERGDKRQVDHVNGDTLDNRRANLRLCTFTQNRQNRKTNKNKLVSLKGVGIKRGKFFARISANGIDHYLGSFSTPEEAHAAYCNAALELHGEFARFS